MNAHLPDVRPVIDAIPGRTVPAGVRMAGLIGVALGIVGLAFGLATGQAAWTAGALVVALVFALAMSQGGVMFAVILTLTEGRWGVPVKRIAESFAFFLPIPYAVLVLFLLIGNGMYPWHEGTWLVETPIDLTPHSPAATASKAIWLSLPFFIARHVLGFAWILGLDFLYVRASLRPDLMAAEERLKATNPGWTRPGWWGPFLSGALADPPSEVIRGERQRRIVGSLLALTYPLLFSMVAFDLIMSLSPWWYANMFGAWFFVSSFWIAVCTLGITMMLAKDWLGIGRFVRNNVSHDLGKLTLALTMFWAYTLYAQILPIWYTNMPEETDFLLIRIFLPEWAWMARAVAVLCFITPFTVLVSRGIKKMKWPMVGIWSLILIGMFLERTLLVMPGVWFEPEFPIVNFLLISIPIWLGFLGAFVTVVSTVLASVPPIPITDPHLETHPWDVHVHSLDAAHTHH